MLIELLWVGVCRIALSLYQNGFENVLILLNYSAGPHQRHVTEWMRARLDLNFANDGASAKVSPFRALIVGRK